MDAELWVGKRKPAESHRAVSVLASSKPFRTHNLLYSLLPHKCSHHIAVGSFEWMAVVSRTPISSWPWTSPEGPASPWSSCRPEVGVIGESQRGSLRVMRLSFLSQSPGLLSLGLLPHGLWQCPMLPKHLYCACLPMPGLGTAVLEVLVRLYHLPIPPALTTHKLHLQVKGARSMCPWGTLLEDGGMGW